MSVARALAPDTAALELWCYRMRGHPHRLGGGTLTAVPQSADRFSQDDLELLGAEVDAHGDVALLMGRIWARFESPIEAQRQASNSGGSIDRGDPTLLQYAFPFTHEESPEGLISGMPLHLTFGCRCGLYVEATAALYRALRPAQTIRLRCTEKDAQRRAEAHPTLIAWRRLISPSTPARRRP